MLSLRVYQQSGKSYVKICRGSLVTVAAVPAVQGVKTQVCLCKSMITTKNNLFEVTIQLEVSSMYNLWFKAEITLISDFLVYGFAMFFRK